MKLWRTGSKNPHTLYIGDAPAGFLLAPGHAEALAAAANEITPLRREIEQLRQNQDAAGVAGELLERLRAADLSAAYEAKFKLQREKVDELELALAQVDAGRVAYAARAEAAEPRLATAIELLNRWRFHDRTKCQAQLAWATDTFVGANTAAQAPASGDIEPPPPDPQPSELQAECARLQSIIGVLEAQILKPSPVPMLLWCPECRGRHLDEGAFATKPHHTHACQHCGHVWRPAIVPTVGVHFLPGFKNDG